MWGRQGELGVQGHTGSRTAIKFPAKARLTGQINNGQELLWPAYFHNVNIIKCREQETSSVPG